MPIKRFADQLLKEGKLASYMELLVNAYNPAAAETAMCRGLLSVGWQGTLHDCDFNQQLVRGVGGTICSTVQLYYMLSRLPTVLI